MKGLNKMRLTKEYLQFCTQQNKAYKFLDTLTLSDGETEEISDLIWNARLGDFPTIFYRMKIAQDQVDKEL